MERIVANVHHDEEVILHEVVQILEYMTSDWDLEFSDKIGADTLLIAGLQFESIDVVQFVVAVEEKFSRRDLPFEQLLMVDGRYVDDLRVADVVAFLHEHLSQ